jgi:hypothetical protein
VSAAGFGPAVPATKRLQAYALDSTATWIGFGLLVHSNNITPRIKKEKLSYHVDYNAFAL